MAEARLFFNSGLYGPESILPGYSSRLLMGENRRDPNMSALMD
jgi:hypothetical protein